MFSFVGPFEESMKKDSKIGLSTAVIVGIIIAAIVVFLCIVFFILCTVIKWSRPSSAEVVPNFRKT